MVEGTNRVFNVELILLILNLLKNPKRMIQVCVCYFVVLRVGQLGGLKHCGWIGCRRRFRWVISFGHDALAADRACREGMVYWRGQPQGASRYSVEWT